MLEGRDQEVAAAVARLRAFFDNPSDLAAYYQHGVEPLPDGGIVLRFAQGRFPASLSRGLTPGDAEALRAAAAEFVRRVCLWERADHYQVLCARREAPGETLKENYHLLMALLHPDRQEAGDGAWPQACAQRVNLAYAALGDEAARREYDARMRTERPRIHAAADPVKARQQANEVRFAKTLIAVGAVVATLIVIALTVEDDDWSDRSVLHASLARLRANPVAGADRPRYVGASSQRASDALADDPEPFAIFRPLMRALVAEEPRPWAPTPKLEPATPAQAAPAPVAAPVPVVMPVAVPPVVAPAGAAPVPVAMPVAVPPVVAPAGAAPLPVRVAQAAAAAAPAPRTATIAPRAVGDAARPTNLEIESLVVALIGYYEAGDADHLMSLVDGGFWRTAQMRQSYTDFFRATRARRLRLERLAWNTESGAAKARGEATVIAEYFDRSAPVERRVDVELDIGVRDGQARITRLSLFPESR